MRAISDDIGAIGESEQGHVSDLLTPEIQKRENEGIEGLEGSDRSAFADVGAPRWKCF